MKPIWVRTNNTDAISYIDASKAKAWNITTFKGSGFKPDPTAYIIYAFVEDSVYEISRWDTLDSAQDVLKQILNAVGEVIESSDIQPSGPRYR